MWPIFAFYFILPIDCMLLFFTMHIMYILQHLSHRAKTLCAQCSLKIASIKGVLLPKHVSIGFTFLYFNVCNGLYIYIGLQSCALHLYYHCHYLYPWTSYCFSKKLNYYWSEVYCCCYYYNCNSSWANVLLLYKVMSFCSSKDVCRCPHCEVLNLFG